MTSKINRTNPNERTDYTYDYENRLTRIVIKNANGAVVTDAQFKYDPFGRRIEKNVNGVISRYFYDNEDIIEESDGSGNVVARYVHGPGIDEPLAMRKNGQDYFYHADMLGSIIAITDTSGNTVQTYSYDSYGNALISNSSFVQPYLYTSREWDGETGLYYYRARYYEPTLGVFITKDPIGFKGGDVNLYRYVGNNSVNWRDAFGSQDPLGFEYVFANWGLYGSDWLRRESDKIESSPKDALMILGGT